MNTDLLWNLFFETGNIDYYMLYKNARAGEASVRPQPPVPRQTGNPKMTVEF